MAQNFLNIGSYWYYFDQADGKMHTDWYQVDGRWYYSDQNGRMKTGWIYSRKAWFWMGSDGAMKTGWVCPDGNWYYLDQKTGKLHTDWHQIDGRWYYSDYNGRMKTGWINSRTSWFYMGTDGAMTTGWLFLGNSWYYTDLKTGKMKTGWQKIDEKWYFFRSSGVMATGWVNCGTDWYYLNGKGIMQKGWTKVGNSYYYLDPDTGIMYRGWLKQDNNWYYLDSSGQMATGAVMIDGKRHSFSSSGVWLGESAQAIPVYFSQRDSRWSSLQFGAWNVYSAGCVPTSLAMIFSGLAGYSILPGDIAAWLYNNTQEYNRRSIGGGGLCAVYASAHWGFQARGLGSLKDLQNELAGGRLVIAYQGAGYFARAGCSHAVVMFQNNNGSTYIYDPWDSGRNGWYTISTLWNQRSTDPDDNKGGYVYYSIWK